MNFRQFEYFLAVARSASFTSASLELGVAQPTLTKSIGALERELGVRLFERLPRGVALTSFGLALRRHAERVGVQLRDAIGEVESLRDGPGGRVAIGAGPAWLRRLLPEAVAAAVTGNPSIRVSLVGGYDDVLLRALRSGELDFVVAELPARENSRDLETMLLASDSLGVCARAGHPLAGIPAVPLRDLMAYRWVMPPRATRAQQRLNALFIAADLPPPEIVVETESMAFLLRLVASSDILSFTVATTLALSEAADLTLLDVPALAAERGAGIITRDGGWLSPAALVIIEELRAISARRPRN